MQGVVLLPMNEYVYMNAPDEVFCKSVRSVGLIIKEGIIEVRKNVFTTSTHTDEEMSTYNFSILRIFRRRMNN